MDASSIFFWSDTHFGHANILRYTERKFNDINEHDEILIGRWNDKVSDNGLVFFLGDFGFASAEYLMSIRKRLKGRIHFIRGNHDRRNIRGALARTFVWIKDYYELKIRDEEMDERQRIVLFHYPIQSWNARLHGAWHLHGHSHGLTISGDNMARVDVGVDEWGGPVSYQQIKEELTRRVLKPVIPPERKE